MSQPNQTPLPYRGWSLHQLAAACRSRAPRKTLGEAGCSTRKFWRPNTLLLQPQNLGWSLHYLAAAFSRAFCKTLGEAECSTHKIWRPNTLPSQP